MKPVASALALALVLVGGGMAAAQDNDINGAPTFATLQDHFELQTGKEVYQYWCWNCHGEGPGKPGTVALESLYKGEVPAVLEERTDLDADAVRFFVRNGNSIMPFFRKTQISDEQLDLLANYLAGTGE